MEGERPNQFESKEVPKRRLVQIETLGHEEEASSFEFLEIPEGLDLQKEKSAYSAYNVSAKLRQESGFSSFSEWLIKTQGAVVAEVETIQDTHL